MNLKVITRTSNKGFTLVELISGLVVTTLVGSLALGAFNYAQKYYNDDKVSTDINQNLTAALDIIGNHVKQAGEGINDVKFPTVEVRKDGNNSIIITRRSLGDESLPICKKLQLGTSNNKIDIRDNNLTSGACSDTTIDPVSGLPPSLLEWQEIRCLQDGVKGCQGNQEEKMSAVLYDGNGKVQIVDYISEHPSPPRFEMPTNSTWTADFNVGPSFAYLIEERRYFLDTASNTLKVSVNGKNPEALITNVTDFQVEITPKDATPVKEFPTPTSNWRDIANVSVYLKMKDINSNKIQEVSGNFYPRNVLSR